MAYKRFSTGVIIRILLLQLTLVCLAFIFARTDLFFSQLILVLVLLFQVYNLIHFVNRTNRELTRFLQAIRLGDFTADFSNQAASGTASDELHLAFNGVIDSYRHIQAQKETQYAYFKLILEHIHVGIISLDEHNQIRLINKAAGQLLHMQHIPTWNSLQAARGEFVQAISHITGQGSQLIEVPVEGEQKQFSLEVLAVKLLREPYRIITFSDIQNEIERKELEAWHKLIRILTHEIMNSITPLVSLTETMQMILEDETGDQKELTAITEENISDIRFSLKTIEKRSGGMLHFLDNYRKLTRIPVPHLESVDIGELFRAIARLMQGELQKGGVKLSIEPVAAGLILKADIKLLEQVLINLLTNSLQALEGVQEPEISLKAYHKKPELVLEVSDNGQGIPQNKLDKIFIPFYSTKERGSGIGLAICKQIVHLHGGTIKVNSQPGLRTTFILYFPQNK